MYKMVDVIKLALQGIFIHQVICEQKRGEQEIWMRLTQCFSALSYPYKDEVDGVEAQMRKGKYEIIYYEGRDANQDTQILKSKFFHCTPQKEQPHQKTWQRREQ